MADHDATPPTPPFLAPHLVIDGAAAAIDFYKQAFGATEMMRLAGPDGRLMHASLCIGGAMVMLMDESREHGALGPKTLGGTPVSLHLQVADADAAAGQAIAAGATEIMPVQSMFWGDRYGVLADPFGHHWSVAHHERDVAPDALRAAARGERCGTDAAETAS